MFWQCLGNISFNEFEATRHREIYFSDASRSCFKTKLRCPWLARKQEANNNPVAPVYGFGQLNSRMNAMYFSMWYAGKGDLTREFGGKKLDYPDSNY